VATQKTTDKHEHDYKKHIAIPVIPTVGVNRNKADEIRSQIPKLGGAFKDSFADFDYDQPQRYILARQCTCSALEAYDLVNELPKGK